METKIRVGDVYLQADGWGVIITRPAMNETAVVTSNYLKDYLVAHTETYYASIDDVKLRKKDVFLFNLCDLFKDAVM